MTKTPTAKQLLDREFLEVRCRLLDIAAALDRVERAEGSGAVRSDARLRQVRDALAVLTDGDPERAQRVQMVFSDAYDPDWR